jgi:hypothetical protein
MRRFVVVAPSPVSGNSFVIELLEVAAATPLLDTAIPESSDERFERIAETTTK